MTEAEKRVHRCCFAGQQPKKLKATEEEIRAWLEEKIRAAIADGYVTFITGMSMGADIWAGETVVRLREENPDLHLIAAVPYPGFGSRWKEEWKSAFYRLLKQADLVRNICPGFQDNCFDLRNQWLIAHSSRVIAVCNGEAGSAQSIVDAGREQGMQVDLYPFEPPRAPEAE